MSDPYLVCLCSPSVTATAITTITVVASLLILCVIHVILQQHESKMGIPLEDHYIALESSNGCHAAHRECCIYNRSDST